MDEAKRTQILSLATDFPRLWVDPNTPDRERKRMVRLILDDVTLIREGGELVAHIRFRGSATHTLRLPIVDLRRTSSEIREEIARLLDDRSDGEIAAILNQRGPNIRRKYGLIDRFVRYRAAGC